MDETTTNPRARTERVQGRVRALLSGREMIFELRQSGLTVRQWRGRKRKEITLKELVDAVEGQFLMHFGDE